jgi:hypothetical protein
MSAQALLGRSLQWGFPARELEPTVAYRLRIDIGGWWRSSVSPLMLPRSWLKDGSFFEARWGVSSK